MIIENIKRPFELITDREISLGRKTAIFLSIIPLVVFMEATFRVTYSFNLNTKLKQVCSELPNPSIKA